MKPEKFRKLMLRALVAILFFQLHAAYADEGLAPDALVKQMVSRLRGTGEPTVILDYVHWPTAYAHYPESEKMLARVQSPEDLHHYMQSVLSDPEKFMREQLTSRIDKLPPASQEQLRKQMLPALQQLTAIKQRIHERIQDTSYDVGAAEITGDTAKVPLVAKLGTDTQNTTVDLVKIDGRWYLPSVDFAKAEGGRL